MRTEIKCPICGNKLILLGQGMRGFYGYTSLSIELFCDKCMKVFFIRLDDLKEDAELNLLEFEPYKNLKKVEK